LKVSSCLVVLGVALHVSEGGGSVRVLAATMCDQRMCPAKRGAAGPVADGSGGGIGTASALSMVLLVNAQSSLADTARRFLPCRDGCPF
jgi:hypothetical protein